MVWRISKEITKKQATDAQKTAYYGLLLIVPLGLLCMGNRTHKDSLRSEKDIQRFRRGLLGHT